MPSRASDAREAPTGGGSLPLPRDGVEAASGSAERLDALGGLPHGEGLASLGLRRTPLSGFLAHERPAATKQDLRRLAVLAQIPYEA